MHVIIVLVQLTGCTCKSTMWLDQPGMLCAM